ncbi:tetratricopeptide repeat protein [Streptomyces fradiae]|uniref:tetratricopeptide repeat protein n=1 Tax=Streptomyces fradiae TaxID=1906 RepID=UPI0039888E49
MGEMADRLRSTPRSDLRALERVCEEVAIELNRTGTVPDFAVSSADFEADAFLICADQYWRLRFLAEPSLATAMRCALWLAGHVADPGHRRTIEEKWALGYGFITCNTIDADTTVETVTAQIEQLGEHAVDAAFFACLHQAAKLRASFAFGPLDRLLSSSSLAQATAHRRTEPVLIALRSMAAFGDRTHGPGYALDLMTEAWAHHDRSRAAVDICLNGLANSRPFPAHGQVLTEHALQAVAAYPDDHAMRYWLAIGHQKNGRYEDAGAAIDEALRLLPAHGGRGSHGLLLEQYRSRRAAIHDEQRLAGSHPSGLVRAPVSRWFAVKCAGAVLPVVLLCLVLGRLTASAPGTALVVTGIGVLVTTAAAAVGLRYLARDHGSTPDRRSG